MSGNKVTLVSFARRPLRRSRFAPMCLAALLTASVAAPPAAAQSTADRDPRNWPTVTRMVTDRYENAGRVRTLRVFAKRSDYFNCGYSGEQAQRMAFTLLGGPLETVTGYMPRRLGALLVGVLAKDPWTPITVQVRYDPTRLSDLCNDQVDILKWSLGWKYPDHSVSPGRPDPNVQPKADEIAHLHAADKTQGPLWDQLLSRKVRRVAGMEPPAELATGQKVQLIAGTRLSRAYHCSFKGRTKTHWALRLHDGKGAFVHGYLPKGPESRKLVDYIALHRNVLLTVQGTTMRAPMSHYCPFQVEVTGWRITPRPKLKTAR